MFSRGGGDKNFRGIYQGKKASFMLYSAFPKPKSKYSSQKPAKIAKIALL
jgi:hypothetical protein